MTVVGCIVLGCQNPVVRVMEHKDNPTVRFGLCAFHVRVAVRYLPPESVREMVFGGRP